MNPEQNDKGLRSSNRDFSPRWHLICAGATAAALFIAYFAAKKIIFG